jgi:Zn-dependent M16 (insulinase) family peptidase
MSANTPLSNYEPGASIHGYTVSRAVPLPEREALFLELFHAASGARHIHIQNSDRENVFAVAFKTVPRNSTGVAHILEHTALCGSKKYPVRDPFFSMIRRSMNSFMNAFTAPDWTMYPFASQNRTDFHNLMGVYLDAAFFPRLLPLSFKQEGHRLEFAPSPKPGEPSLEYKGVVYNEMYGAMSSPDQVMGHALLEALYPDTTYGNNSGGDPACIVTLTREALLDFHKRHYHPSNAWFYTYGSLPLEEHLGIIENEVLRHFSALDPDTAVPSQPRFPSPREKTVPYPASGPNLEKKHQAALAWLLCGIEDTLEVLALVLLEKILLGNAAAPLRKALIDSGLGSDLSDGTGFDAELRDTMFSCGLKDTRAEDAKTIESLILDTLASLAKNGIEQELIDTALHQYEFRRREVTSTPYPYGLKLFMQACPPWLHGADPVRGLDFGRDLDTVRERATAGGFFEGLIQTYFLDNPHRVLLRLAPDPGLQARQREKEQEKLFAIEKDLTPEAEKAIREDALALERLQDEEEDISCLPTLTVGDIPPDVERIPPGGTPAPSFVIPYEAACGGVLYYTVVAPAGHLPLSDIELVPFLCHVSTQMGTRNRNYVELARKKSALTGGVSLGAGARTLHDKAGSPLPIAAFDMKCLSRNADAALELAEEILLSPDFSDIKRLKELLLEYRSALESQVVHSGHLLAMSLASRSFSTSLAIEETWHGVHQLLAAKKWCGDLSENALRAMARRMEELAVRLFARDTVKAGVVGADKDVEKACAAAARFVARLPEKAPSPGGESVLGIPLPVPAREAWTTATQVSFVAHALPAPRPCHPDAPVFSIAAKLLRALFLHKELREKGGAYGGYARANIEAAMFYMGSYRDPQVARTIEVYRQAYDFLARGEYGEEDVAEAILQTAADMDKPDPPGQAARKDFFRKILGVTDEKRQEFKDGALGVTRARIMEVGRRYFNPVEPLAPVAVITSPEALERANQELGAEKALEAREI